MLLLSPATRVQKPVNSTWFSMHQNWFAHFYRPHNLGGILSAIIKVVQDKNREDRMRECAIYWRRKRKRELKWETESSNASGVFCNSSSVTARSSRKIFSSEGKGQIRGSRWWGKSIFSHMRRQRKALTGC